MSDRRRGRPVSQASRQAALVAATTLLLERGWGGFTVDEVARRSRVSKATIYRHWTGALEVAAEAFGEHVTDAVPVARAGDVEDVASALLDQVHRLAAFYARREGRLVAELLGAAVSQPGGTVAVAHRFFGVRRQATRELIDAGKSRGELCADVETDLMIDLLFGPVVFRMFNGLGPLHPDAATGLAAVALSALTR